MPPLLLAQKGIDWRVQCEHHKIQVFKSPENGTKTSHRYKIDHNRALKGMCDCLMAVHCASSLAKYIDQSRDLRGSTRPK